MKQKYAVRVVMSFWQTIEVEAESEAEVKATAYDLFDETKPMELGDGEVYDVRVIEGGLT